MRGSRGWACVHSCCWAVAGALVTMAQCCGGESWALSSCRSTSSGWGTMLFISMGCVHVCRVPPRQVALQPYHSSGDLFSGQLLPTVKWLPGECLAKMCFWRGSVIHLHKVVENLLLPGWTKRWSRCPLQVLRSNLRWLNAQLWFSFYNFFHFCWRQSTVYFPTCQSPDARHLSEMRKDAYVLWRWTFFRTSSTSWFHMLRTNINGSTCVTYSCSIDPTAKGTQTLFLPALTREREYYFLWILAGLLEFLNVEAHAMGVQMEILL